MNDVSEIAEFTETESRRLSAGAPDCGAGAEAPMAEGKVPRSIPQGRMCGECS